MKFGRTTRRRPARVGALLVAGAALGLVGIDPTANADKAIIPVMPDVTHVTIDHGQTPTGSFGIPPFYDGYSYEQDATYTDVLGTPVDTSLGPHEPVWNTVTVGPYFESTESKDFYPTIAGVASRRVSDGSTFDHIATGPLGFDFALTPVVELDGTITNNINDAWVFDPGGLGFNGDGIVNYAARRAELLGRGRDDTVLRSPRRSRLFQHVKDA